MAKPYSLDLRERVVAYPSGDGRLFDPAGFVNRGRLIH